ncbi:MAG TPA: amino acid permease [Rhizomicrobium sp.]|nr:amino acid permease [Rhizomicrobium sp.]
MNFIARRKPIDAMAEGGRRLKPTLSWPHLVALGVGAIVGTGIYTLTGIGAGLAGPAVLLSFALCGVICACAALCYAEMSTLMPVAGSAYTYSYAVLGELVAWIIGWSLVLEYTVAAAAVAVGWSAHFTEFLGAIGLPLPAALAHGTLAGGILDLPAAIIGCGITGLLILGTRESATVNLILVAVKLVALLLFVTLAAPAFDVARFHPFAPYGFGAHVDTDGVKRGVLAAAALIFFAFYGFDAVSTAAEETKNPARDLSIGIVGSMVICTVIYIAVAAAALGAASYLDISHTGAPLVHVLELVRHPFAAQLVASAAIVALPTVILVLMYGQSRIWFVMARDGLLPERLAALSRRGAPVAMTLFAGFWVVLLAATLPLDRIALLANAGTLAAFIAVALSLLVLRLRDPERPRIFRAPLGIPVAGICMAGCLYLFVTGLPHFTQWWFLLWNAGGLVLYFVYGARHSHLAAAQGAAL